MMRRHASWVVASGFSQNVLAGLDTGRDVLLMGLAHEVTTTASTSSSRISSCPVVWTLASAKAVGHLLRPSGVDIVPATTRDPTRTDVIRRM